MADQNTQIIMRAIGRLEGKVEDILYNQKTYNSKLEKLGDRIITHEKETTEKIQINSGKHETERGVLSKRIGKNETALTKIMAIVGAVTFVISLTFNAIWQWVNKGLN